jgi:ABC-2 type transport system ATP-binding protein
MPAKVVVRNLSKNYGKIAALRDLNLEIGTGEIFGLLGTNGAGKTTAVECLVGLRTVDAGEIAIDGIDLRHQSAEAKQRIGVVLQSTALPDQITPTEALDLFGSLYRQRINPLVLLERFGLTSEAHKRFASLSGGQRQRLALALAFVNKPDLVVLDEPTTGLDAHARRELHEAILRLKDEGHTVLLTTHYLEEAERLCDRVAIINRGQLVATGTPRELIDRVNGHHTVTLLTKIEVSLQRLKELPAVLSVSVEGLSVRLATSDGSRTVQALMPLLATDHIELVDLHLRRATLEEAFVGLTQNDRDKSPGDST